MGREILEKALQAIGVKTEAPVLLKQIRRKFGWLKCQISCYWYLDMAQEALNYHICDERKAWRNRLSGVGFQTLMEGAKEDSGAKDKFYSC